MKVIDLITDLRAGLTAAKKQGQKTIPVVALENYLAQMENAAKAATAQAEATQRDARARFEHEMEVWKIRMPLIFQSTIETGQAALKTGILINGGAAVALLAFIGNMVAKGVNPGRGIGKAMAIFVGGVLLAAFAAAFTYLCQYLSDDHRRASLAFNIAAIVTGLASLIAFACGGWASYFAIPW